LGSGPVSNAVGGRPVRLPVGRWRLAEFMRPFQPPLEKPGPPPSSTTTPVARGPRERLYRPHTIGVLPDGSYAVAPQGEESASGPDPTASSEGRPGTPVEPPEPVLHLDGIAGRWLIRQFRQAASDLDRNGDAGLRSELVARWNEMVAQDAANRSVQTLDRLLSVVEDARARAAPPGARRPPVMASSVASDTVAPDTVASLLKQLSGIAGEWLTKRFQAALSELPRAFRQESSSLVAQWNEMVVIVSQQALTVESLDHMLSFVDDLAGRVEVGATATPHAPDAPIGFGVMLGDESRPTVGEPTAPMRLEI
jgi:hypothetical protein